MSELKGLALCYATIVEALGDFSFACDGGSWVGEVATTLISEVTFPVLAVRTFTPSGAPVRGVAYAAVMER